MRVVLLVVKTPLGETQSRGLTLIRPIRKPANLGEAGGTHGEDFSSPVGPVARTGPVGDPWTRQTHLWWEVPLGTGRGLPLSNPSEWVLLEGSAKIGAGRHRKG